MIEESVFDSFKFPTTWQMEKLRRVFSNTKTLTSRQLPLLGANVALGVTERYEGDGRPAASEDLSRYKVVEVNDIIMNPLGKPHGSIGRSNLVGITSPAYWVLRCNAGFEPRYAHYLLRSEVMINEYKRRSKNLPPNQFDLPWEQFREIEIGFPSLQEQRRIADFLDAMISTIDLLVVAKNQEMQLIAELEQGLIDNVVASEHMMKLKHICQTPGQYGLNITPDQYRESGIRLLRTSDFGSREVEPIFVDGPLEDRHIVKVGDVLLTRSGTIGQSFLVTEGEAGSAYAGFLIRYRTRKTYDPKFLSLVVRSSDFQQQVKLGAVVSTIPNFNADRYDNLLVPDLNLAKQQSCIEAVNTDAQNLLDAASLITRSIKEMEELKTSLITAAVTGTFDVTTGRSVA